MSGGTIPYHLRQNKAIDRNIFVELLARASGYNYVYMPDYVYIGFGGPFLEDFKVMHSRLGIHQMISLEMDSRVLARQKFNIPLNCIKCENKKSDEFIKEWPFDQPTIIWLDYTNAIELGAQLNDIAFLISKLGDWDFVKVTLNAAVGALADGRTLKDGESLFEKRLSALQQRAGNYVPTQLEEDALTNNNYPATLCKILENAIKSGASGRKRSYFQPLTAFAYADGQRMLTLAGVIMPDTSRAAEEFFLKTGIKEWPLGTIDWGRPKPIVVPQLSLKERIRIEEMLPTADADQIHAALGFLIGDDEEESLEGIRNYIQYYKQFPYFSRIVF